MLDDIWLITTLSVNTQNPFRASLSISMTRFSPSYETLGEFFWLAKTEFWEGFFKRKLPRIQFSAKPTALKNCPLVTCGVKIQNDMQFSITSLSVVTQQRQLMYSKIQNGKKIHRNYHDFIKMNRMFHFVSITGKASRQLRDSTLAGQTPDRQKAKRYFKVDVLTCCFHVEALE